MYEGSPYSDPNLHLPAAGASGHADGVLHGTVAGLPMTGTDVVFYLAVVAALVLAGTLLVVLGSRVGWRP
jgi:hypothetical protein